jgi:hypothetical protein
VAVLALLLAALTARVFLQTARRPRPRRRTRRRLGRLLDGAITPLLVVFVLVVLERFRDLS